MINFNGARMIQLNPVQGRVMNDNILKGMINNLTKSAEQKLSDISDYAPVSTSFYANNKDYKAVALCISQDEDKFSGHMLEIAVLDPRKQTEYKRPLVYGDKNVILSYLKDKNVVKNIKQDFNAILQDIKNT